MKNNISIIITIVFMFMYPFDIFAQQNSVGIGIEAFSMTKYPEALFVAREMSCSYKRHIIKNFYVEGSYSMWETFFLRHQIENGLFVEIPEGFITGKLIEMRSFKTLDLNIKYEIPYHKHKLSLGIGPSYAWSSNSYITDVYFNYYVGEVIWGQRQSWTHYWGIAPNVSYDYSIINERLLIGVDYKYRFYHNMGFDMYEFGAHLNVGFGDPWAKRKKRSDMNKREITNKL